VAKSLQKSIDPLRELSVLTEKVSALELALETAIQLTHHDTLTGLPNRRLLLDRFNQATALAKRHRQQLALIFLDIDDFKCVNDDLGHDAGDMVLQQVSARLLSSVRESDTVCRYGGDEFVILLTDIAHHENAVKAVQKVRAKLAVPYVNSRYSIRLTVTDGMAMYPRDAQCLTDLLQIADRSMFSNKRRSDTGLASNIWLNDAPFSD
jgi:diguanylate cyclase (GGDEF)-like protein